MKVGAVYPEGGLVI